MTSEADIRDAYHLTPPEQARGPDGDLLAFWRDAARLRLTGPDWRDVMQSLVGSVFADDFPRWVEAGADSAKIYSPLTACVFVMRMVLEVDDRAERVACMLSDVVLALALQWPTVLPVSAQHLTKAMLRDLAGGEPGADLKVQASLLISIEKTIRLGRDLARHGAALKAVAPKLRAKGSAVAVDLFLSEDAVAPSTMLSPTILMTDRAARRFCDRLVELGVAQELTGRPAFRLYGIAP